MAPIRDDPATLITDAGTGRVLLRSLAVRVVGEERVVPLGPRTLIVGSHADADVVLQDERVSRRHCELQLLEDGVRVRDLDSKNGVRVGGARVREATLTAGQSFVVGRAELQITAETEMVPDDAGAAVGGLLGNSAVVRALRSVIVRAAQAPATVLVLGETGTGKEHIARALHEEGPRAAGPFVVVDCASLTPALLTSELFGHKRGAFTGAEEDRAGAFEAARGGTVFLDEVGELPLELQPNLLRVLEQRTVRRVGENQARPVDVRIVAATHRDLASDVEAGRFRRDLYHRLAVLTLAVPPLRGRGEDVLLLADHFLQAHGRGVAELSSSDRALLRAHPWPGNVRELRNAMERSAVLANGPLRLLLDAHPSDSVKVPPASSPSVPSTAPRRSDYRGAREEAIADFEKGYVIELLRAHDGNVSRAARAAGIDRNYLHRLMKRYGIVREERGE